VTPQSSIPPSATAATLRAEFRSRFGKPCRVFSAPGRVNLIGEHTDYNQGLVLPIAISQRTRVAVAPRDDRLIVCRSDNVGEEKSFSLDEPAHPPSGSWLDYVEGVARTLAARGTPVGGAEMLIASEVPPGAGLSSSAALELSVGLALCGLAQETPEPLALALVGQTAEHDFVGVKCGIMDQLVCALGKAGHALLIDCSTLSTTQVPIPAFEARIVVCDTRVRHRHAASGYNQRRAECEEALKLLKAASMQLESLSDLGVHDLREVERHLQPPLLGRVRHVVSENARTRGAVDALRHGHLPGLGRMMTGSHLSLRDDYAVSSAELDFVVEVGLREKAVLGARMTGGGFGGAAILLVRSAGVTEVQATLAESYHARFGLDPHLYVTESANGMRADDES
jgi:galactokinase